AATGRDLVNGNVFANVAAIRYPPISATAVTAAISPRFRPDHEVRGPPDASWGGGQDCPGGGPGGGQDCGGCQDCPGGRCGTGPAGAAAAGGRTRYPRAWAYSEATHSPAAGSMARRSDSALATSRTAVSGSMCCSSTCCLISPAMSA